MQRDIVFRGKRTDNGQWVEGYYFTTPLTNENIMVPIEDGHYFMCGIQRHVIARNGTVFEVDAQTVGQYTWLCDKNGERIFEDDIVRVQNPYNACWSIDGGRVIFSTEYVGGWVVTSDGNDGLNIGTRTKYVEVIGNIHDNPEMIGGAM